MPNTVWVLVEEWEALLELSTLLSLPLSGTMERRELLMCTSL